MVRAEVEAEAEVGVVVDVVGTGRTIWAHHVDSTRSSQVVRAVRDEAEAEVEVGLDVVDTVIEVSVVGMVSEVSVEDMVSAVSEEVIEVVVVVDEVVEVRAAPRRKCEWRSVVECVGMSDWLL